MHAVYSVTTCYSFMCRVTLSPPSTGGEDGPVGRCRSGVPAVHRWGRSHRDTQGGEGDARRHGRHGWHGRHGRHGRWHGFLSQPSWLAVQTNRQSGAGGSWGTNKTNPPWKLHPPPPNSAHTDGLTGHEYVGAANGWRPHPPPTHDFTRFFLFLVQVSGGAQKNWAREPIKLSRYTRIPLHTFYSHGSVQSTICTKRRKLIHIYRFTYRSDLCKR